MKLWNPLCPELGWSSLHLAWTIITTAWHTWNLAGIPTIIIYFCLFDHGHAHNPDATTALIYGIMATIVKITNPITIMFIISAIGSNSPSIMFIVAPGEIPAFYP